MSHSPCLLCDLDPIPHIPARQLHTHALTVPLSEEKYSPPADLLFLDTVPTGVEYPEGVLSKGVREPAVGVRVPSLDGDEVYDLSEVADSEGMMLLGTPDGSSPVQSQITPEFTRTPHTLSKL